MCIRDSIWGTLPEGADMQRFVQLCLDQKVAVVPGNAFYTDESAPCRSFRMNFSAPADEDIDRGVALMAEALAEL